MATLADLLPQIFARVEEPDPNNPIFWVLDEGNFAAIEAINDLMLMVGRPTQIVQQPFDIVPNTPWQTVPKGIFAITNIQGSGSEAYKITLENLDYLQTYGGSDWENDIGETILQWAPIGLNRFVVHPCIADSQTVLLSGIAYPCTEVYPYNSASIDIPFADQFLQALEKYAAAYLRIKEGSDEMTEGNRLYQSYLSDAKRMTEIEDRMDPWIFNLATGVQTVSNPTTLR